MRTDKIVVGTDGTGPSTAAVTITSQINTGNIERLSSAGVWDR